MTRYPPRRGKPLLLVVDDDEMQRFLCRECLEPAFDLIDARDGQAAIATFIAAEPDLVLLDVMMPDTDGFATCRGIRALPGGRTTPVLMTTGLEDVASIEAAYAAGATDFISKPINWALLPHRIRYLLRSQQVLRDFILSERWLAEAQRIAAVGSFICSPAAATVRLSAEAARIFGYADDPGEVSLRSLLRRVVPCDRRQVIAALRKLERQRVVEADHRIALPDGEMCHVSLRAECAVEPSGAPCILGTCHDITERKKIELELRLARDEAQGADAAKTAFLATMSHELQTPLNAIIGFAEILASRQGSSEVSSDKTLSFLRCILDAGRSISASVDQVLIMARLEVGAYRPEIELLDLRGLAESTVAVFRRSEAAAGRDIAVETALDAAIVAADERAVGRMLGNLLSNAVKFSETKSRVTVTIDRTPEGSCRLSVSDRGVGMSPAQIGLAVAAFRQLDARLAREHSGLGLGLAVTKRLIEAHGGALEIASATNQGTRVTLVFPPAEVSAARQVPDLTAAA
jgi:two-component system, cell cycle sensor histidine kinase PleC